MSREKKIGSILKKGHSKAATTVCGSSGWIRSRSPSNMSDIFFHSSFCCYFTFASFLVDPVFLLRIHVSIRSFCNDPIPSGLWRNDRKTNVTNMNKVIPTFDLRENCCPCVFPKPSNYQANSESFTTVEVCRFLNPNLIVKKSEFKFTNYQLEPRTRSHIMQNFANVFVFCFF